MLFKTLKDKPSDAASPPTAAVDAVEAECDLLEADTRSWSAAYKAAHTEGAMRNVN